MPSRAERRTAAIERMADHLLREGLASATLRPLAAAAGTSDRMLLYYFADREELLAATLEAIAVRLTGVLDAALAADIRLNPKALLEKVWSTVGTIDTQPYMRLWLELAAVAGRQREPETRIARAIMDGFVAWVSAHLDDPDPTAAALVLARLEGMLFLDAVGRRDLADLAASAV